MNCIKIENLVSHIANTMLKADVRGVAEYQQKEKYWYLSLYHRLTDQNPHGETWGETCLQKLSDIDTGEKVTSK